MNDSIRTRDTDELGRDVFTKRIPAHREFLAITPSFNCGCINWDTNGDEAAALQLLLMVFNVGPENVVEKRVLSLGCREHRQHG